MIRFTSDGSSHGWGYELRWSCTEYQQLESDCGQKIEISNTEHFHNNPIYNDIYQLDSINSEKPIYKSVGLFPIKIVQWNSPNSMWIITGQV